MNDSHDIQAVEDEAQANLPSVIHAAITLFGLAAWVSYGIFGLGAGLHGILLLGLVWVAINSVLIKATYPQIQRAMVMGMNRAMPAMMIFLMIGVVIVTFIQSGTVGSLIYYGLKFMHPAVFLPAGLILCSIMSVAVGTSWGHRGNGRNCIDWGGWCNGNTIADNRRNDYFRCQLW